MYNRGVKRLDRAGAIKMIRRATTIRIPDGDSTYKGANRTDAQAYINAAPEPITVSEWYNNRCIAMWIN